MPERTNDFQELIALIESQLAPAGATITTSKMLYDELAREYHEVDIVLETVVGIHPLTIAIECIDWDRPADRPWVQKMDGKHRDTDSKLILVSRSGFSKTAEALAKKRGIPTLTFDEAAQVNWPSFIDGITNVQLDRRNVALLSAEVLWAGEQGPQDASSFVFRYEDGSESTLSELLDEILKSEMFRTLLYSQTLPDGTAEMQFRLNPPDTLTAITTAGSILHPKAVTMLVACRRISNQVPIRVASYGPVRVAAGTVESMGSRLTLALIERDGEEPILALSARRASPSEKRLGAMKQGARRRRT